MTTNSELILNVINISEDHLTAEQIFLKLKETSTKIALATVYNNLNALYENNLIRKVVVEGYPDRYDKIVRHDHLVCKQCGRLTDIMLKDLTIKLKEEIGEDILSYDLKVSYICPSCKQIKVSK
ncbi:MAG TPA: transcriptional repressor [Lachnoclostridium sp.]|uniref:Fur family transcriptional regulator n=1 Tax=Lacrimispora sp. TaxID=2719234 RepID=UPI000EBE73BE|nr:transcriptional repressor [Lacrimispora sp.]HCD45629.1 transcriptional repressor [Lachnoclostridium sp.]